MEHYVLVRTPSECDPYHATLDCPARTHHLPVLSTAFTDSRVLAETISRGPTARYAGVIVTSQRAVEAWSLASSSSLSPAAAGWSSVPFFVVGPATAAALEPVLPTPTPPLLGAASGSASRLASTITAHFPTPPPLPLLYLTGDKNSDSLPNTLALAGLATTRVQVYATLPTPDFELSLSAILDRIHQQHPHPTPPTVWFALFSPSGARLCLDALARLPAPGRVRLAGIGPTTREYVERERGLTLDAVAHSPDAVELVRAMRNAPP